MKDKQEMFCLEYLKDLNGTQAAIRAGYSENTAESQACRLLTNANIRSRVKELMDERSKITLVDAEYVINNLVEVVKRCKQAEPVLIWNPDTKSMVESGEYKFDSQGANKALDLLGKHVGMFEKDNAQKKPVVNNEIIIKGEKFADKD